MSKRMKLRSLLIGVIFSLLFVGLIGRLYWVQIVDASVLLSKAEESWSQNKQLQASRGTIYDRNYKVLAQDGLAFTVVVFPKIINANTQELEVVEALAPILNMSDPDKKQKLHSLVTRKRENGDFYGQVEIRNEGWKIESDLADEILGVIEQKGLKGVHLIEEQKRYYPAQELASHVLGYTNKEGKAILGLESFYDSQLKGEAGFVKYDKDGKSIELPDSKVTYQPAVNGLSMKLTIDENIQMFIEQTLETAYKEHNPKQVIAVAVDPKTMEVLGMANYPNYNPNEYWNFENYSDFNNQSIAAQYEPGSTFKIVTLAGAVEEGLFDPDEMYTSGKISVTGGIIRDHNYGRGWGEGGRITYLEGLKRSSNVAFVKLGYDGLGATKLREYISAFGFGQKTGIDLPGEISGVINFRDSVPLEVATATFGQGRVAVTAIQQLAAVSAIANGGKLMQPYVVKEIIDSETNEVIQANEPVVVRQVISEKTSRLVGEYLEQVVSDQVAGTGRLAYIDGYRMAGKTGTAQKVIDGKYAENKWIISFIGYAPIENPEIALIVIMDEPEMEGDYRTGGGIIGPVFKDIMQKSLRYFGVASKPKESAVSISTALSVTIPDVTGYSLFGAVNELKKYELDAQVLGDGNSILSQFPVEGTAMGQGQRVYLLTESSDNISIPDFRGLSLLDALQMCGLLGLSCQVSGEGYVVDQKLITKDGIDHLELTLQPISEEH